MLGDRAKGDTGTARCTIGSKTAAGRAGTCSSGTVPTFSSEDETVEISSLDLIAPANLAVDAVARSRSAPKITQHRNAGLTGGGRRGGATWWVALCHIASTCWFRCHGRRVVALPLRCARAVHCRCQPVSKRYPLRLGAAVPIDLIPPNSPAQTCPLHGRRCPVTWPLGGSVLLWHAESVSPA